MEKSEKYDKKIQFCDNFVLWIQFYFFFVLDSCLVR